MDDSLEVKIADYRKMVDCLMDKKCNADIILSGGYIINVVTREIYKGDIAVKGKYILMTGDCSAVKDESTEIIDVNGKFLSPGFIDCHMHFESSMLTVTEFSKLSVASGTTTLFADPHEIGNVLGIKGMQAMVDEARTLPNRVLFTIPCMVPDVPSLETPGDTVSSLNIRDILSDELVAGLGEMQGISNTKPVYNSSPELIDDMLSSVLYAKKLGKTVEGNAPSLFGADLAVHNIVCGNETSCHETTTKEECAEKLRNGVTVFMREGSTQKNMSECIRCVTEDGMDSRKLVLVTDDMVAEDLLATGHMNEVIRRTIAEGIDPVEAIQMATINSATHYNRKDIGIIAPGKAADICVISDLNNVTVEKVMMAGKIVAENGKLLIDIPKYTYPQYTKNSVKRKRVSIEDLAMKSNASSERVRVIKVIVDQNLTDCLIDTLAVKDGIIMPDTDKDIIPLLNVERHGKSNRIGKTFVNGMKLRYGAIAQSIGHDTHNILACGTNYDDISIAINRVSAMGGGIAMIKDSKVVGDLVLDVGGLISDELTGEELCNKLKLLHSLAKSELGCSIHSPFMHLSFLSLITSPKWKISDMGLINAETYEIIESVIR